MWEYALCSGTLLRLLASTWMVPYEACLEVVNLVSIGLGWTSNSMLLCLRTTEARPMSMVSAHHVAMCLFDLCNPCPSIWCPRNFTEDVANVYFERLSCYPRTLNRSNRPSSVDNKLSKLSANTKISSKKLRTLEISCNTVSLHCCHMVGMFAAPYTARVERMKSCVDVRVNTWLNASSTSRWVYASCLNDRKLFFLFFGIGARVSVSGARRQ